MPKLFRRTWERQKYGRNGALSAPLPTRGAADGAIAGATFAAPVAVFTSATGAFVASDVGRKIRLTNTPSNRYDGNFVIDSVNSATSINLRYNHNVGGTPTSLARFMENGTAITWRIHESCTFTADASGDIETFHSGSYIYIESSNVANRGLWLISNRTSSQVVTLSKSYIWYAIDNTPFTVHTIDASLDFVPETSLNWYLTDRQSYDVMDQYEIILQFFIDCGWSVYQNRGSNASLSTLRDIVLRSVGESDALIPGGKSMFLRCGLGGQRAGTKTWNFLDCDFAVFHHWDPTQTATAPGNGVGGCKFHEANGVSFKAAAPSFNWNASNGGGWSLFPYRYASGTNSFTNIGRNGLLDNTHFVDWSMFGDADEVVIDGTSFGGVNSPTSAHLSIGHLQPVGSNPNTVTVINNVTAGTNKDLNTGTVDIASLTPPYQIGDKITLVGRKTASPAEFIETTTIVSFNNTDPNNRLVRVASLALAYGNGPDTLKLQIGEDPFPVTTSMWTATNNAFLHNLTNLADPTGRDFDTTNRGSVSASFQIWSQGFLEIDPNQKTGRYGVLALGVKNATSGEVRGRFRYRWEVPDYLGPLGMKLVASNNTDVYVLTNYVASGRSKVVGPMPKIMAAVYS